MMAVRVPSHVTRRRTNISGIPGVVATSLARCNNDGGCFESCRIVDGRSICGFDGDRTCCYGCVGC